MIIQDVPLECINHAAMVHNVPATVIISVLKVEGGKLGTASKNKNGTYDYGPMQINTCWLNKLSKFGITKNDLRYNPCINVKAGAWILSQSISSGKDLWHGVGIYHSHKKHLNKKYSNKVKDYYNQINKTFATMKKHNIRI